MKIFQETGMFWVIRACWEAVLGTVTPFSTKQQD